MTKSHQSYLTTPCYTVQDGKIVKGTLSDFSKFIESTTRPSGIGPKYYATKIDDVWGVAKWATWGGPEAVVQEYETEAEAKAAAEETYVQDILNNREITIHLERTEAERELTDLQA